MKTTPAIFATKSQLIDYVTRRDFNDFREEIRDFRSQTEERFNRMDKRFDSLEDTMRIQTGIIIEQSRADMKMAVELFKKQ